MSIFNRQSRAASMFRTSAVGTGCRLLNIVAGFAYRTVFIALLSERYLGINGLFWNVFRLLSLTELGVGVSICYRFYRPIAENDVVQVGRLMNFYRHVYLAVAGVILSMGLALLPFLDGIVKDTSEVPADVNLTLVYLLFLFQSVSTYTFSYRLTIWSADRKNYVSILLSQLAEILRFGSQMLVLWLTGSFTLMLIVGIFSVQATNWLFSVWTTHRYAPVFAVKERLPRAECVQIFKDAFAVMLHRVGSTVVSSTDSLVISKCIGLGAVGLYSNYMLLYHAAHDMIKQLIGGFTTNYGQAFAMDSPKELYCGFRCMQFFNLFLAGLAASLFCLLVGPFVRLWLGERMCLPAAVEVAIAALIYVHIGNITLNSHVMASGLFVRDRLRPLIESAINLIVSVVLARRIGLAGVVIGTLVSCGLTAFWRAPYLLFRERFGISPAKYWTQYLTMVLFPLAFSASVRSFVAWRPESWGGLALAGTALTAAYVATFSLGYGWLDDFKRARIMIRERFSRICPTWVGGSRDSGNRP